MYRNSEDFVRDEINRGSKESALRLAYVTKVSNGMPYLTFLGEDSESKKGYAYLSSYPPTVGDLVCVGNVNGSLLILGKVRR